MKQYFDIYIRQAGAILEALPWAEDGTLTGWHKLELPDKGAKFSLEGQKREIGDGTELSDGEVANFSGATLWVTSDEWDELREDFHNQKCDLVLYDHNAGMIVAVCYGMQMNISTILTSGESELITVSGTKTMSNAGADMYLFLEREETEGEVLMGIEITGELEAFSANEGEASASQYYNVKGIRLAERIDITASTGIELSTDEATWDNPISVAKDFDDKIHVRISEEAEGGEIDGKIAHASEGVTSRNLAVSGTVASASTVTETPTFSGSAGVYSIACATAGASIYYTLDGSTPDATKTLYATPLDIIFPQTLKAIAIKDAVSSEVATLAITESVWTIDPAADGTKYIRIRCADTGQTLTVTGGAEIMLTSDGTWGTSVDIPSGDANRDVYFRGNDTGGKLLIPSPQYVTYLNITGTGTSITGSINGMALTYLGLFNTYTSITGSITGMPLTSFSLNATGSSITGAPSQIGTPLAYIRIIGGTSYNYPWTSQTFGGTKQTWTVYTMSIDCMADAPTPEQFNTWLGGTPGINGLADVSKEVTPGTVTLTLKNTPTEDAMAAKGVGPTDDGSGMYRMLALGYTLTLGE